jgi:hypothetical protein
MAESIRSEAPPIFLVSGGLGTSGEQIVRTVLAQFPAPEPPVVVVPRVRRVAELEGVVERAAATGGTIVYTLVNGELRDALGALAQARRVFAIALMGELLSHLAQVLGHEPAGKPGLYRLQREDYFKRMDAIAFAVGHDDAQRIEELSEAEIVLVGPSRVGKTPLSIYLSVLGWRVANVPLIPGVPPPAELLEVDRRRVVGLVIEAAQLISHRRWRRATLGIPQDSPYTNPAQIYEEIEWARGFCRQNGFAILDVTDRPIESSAEEVIALINRRVSGSS